MNVGDVRDDDEDLGLISDHLAGEPFLDSRVGRGDREPWVGEMTDNVTLRKVGMIYHRF